MFGKASTLALAALSSVALAQISDDFENGWNNNTWPVYAPDCNQGGTVSLDSTTAHSGKNSIKVTGGSNGYCGHIFFGTTAVPSGSDVYVRTWAKHTLAVGDAHVTFIVMPDTSMSGKHLRLSGQESIFEYNRESDDATLPSLSPQGISDSTGFPTGTWECIEYHLSSDGTIETWVNSAAIPGLTYTPGGSNPDAGGWGSAYKPSITGVYFGWESYAGSVDTVWYDDVAIDSKRIGCGSGSTTSPTSTTKSSTPPSSTSSPVSSSKPASSTTSTKPTTLSTTVKPTTTTTTSKPVTTSTSPANCASKYGQCGGQGWAGATCCASGSTCKVSNQYYSQCL